MNLFFYIKLSFKITFNSWLVIEIILIFKNYTIYILYNKCMWGEQNILYNSSKWHKNILV